MKYRHLWAWDTMMGSYPHWKERMQRLAEEENAPLDAIYRNPDGTWVTFGEIKRESTKERVESIMRDQEGEIR